MKVPQHVACRETTHEEIFRTIPARISAKLRVTGPGDLWLAFRGYHMVAPVPLIGLGSFALIASPLSMYAIDVPFHPSFSLLTAARLSAFLIRCGRRKNSTPLAFYSGLNE